MGEAGSQGTSSGACQAAPSCEPESVPGLLSLPQELISLILDLLPRRSLPNVRLVCRKLDAACQNINRLFIRLEVQPIENETHHLFRLDTVGGTEARKAATLDSRPVRCSHGPSTWTAGSPGLPSWSNYLCELHLSLRTEPPPDPQPRLQGHAAGTNVQGAGIMPDAQIQDQDWNVMLGLAPAVNFNGALQVVLQPAADGEGAGPQEEQAAPGQAPADAQVQQNHHAVQIHVQLPNQEIHVQAPHQPGADVAQGPGVHLQPGMAQPQAAGAAAWAQHLADQLQHLLQQAGNDAANLAVDGQALVAEVEALLAMVAAGPPPPPAAPQQQPQEPQQQLLPEQAGPQQLGQQQQQGDGQPGAPQGQGPGQGQALGQGQGQPGALLAVMVQGAAAAAGAGPAAGPAMGGPFHGPAAAIVGAILAAAGHLQQPQPEQQQEQEQQLLQPQQQPQAQDVGVAGPGVPQASSAASAASGAPAALVAAVQPAGAAAAGGSADEPMEADEVRQHLAGPPGESQGPGTSAPSPAPAGPAGAAATAGNSGDAEMEPQDAEVTTHGQRAAAAAAAAQSGAQDAAPEAWPSAAVNRHGGHEAEDVGTGAEGVEVASGPAAGGEAAAAVCEPRPPVLTPAQAEAVLSAKMDALTGNLLPHLHRLRRLSLDSVPRGCMPAAGSLAAAATSLTELRIARAEPPEPPAPMAPLPPAGFGVAAGAGAGAGAGIWHDALQHLQNLVNLQHPLHHGLHHHHHHHHHGLHQHLHQHLHHHHQLLHQQLLAGVHDEFDNFNPDVDMAMADVVLLGLNPPPAAGDGGGGGDGADGDAAAVEAGMVDAAALEAGMVDAAAVEAGMVDAAAVEAGMVDAAAGDADDAVAGGDGYGDAGAAAAGGQGTSARVDDARHGSDDDVPALMDLFEHRRVWSASLAELLRQSPAAGRREHQALHVAGTEPGPSGRATTEAGPSFEADMAGAGEAGPSAGASGARGGRCGVDYGDVAMRSQSSGSSGGALGSGEGPGPSGSQGLAGAGRPGVSATAQAGGTAAAVQAGVATPGASAAGGESGSPSGKGSLEADWALDDALGSDAAAGPGRGGGGGGGDNDDGGGGGGDDDGGGSGGGGGSDQESEHSDDEEEREDSCDATFWSRVATLPQLRSLVLRGGRLRAADMAGLVALSGLQQLVVNHVVNMHPGLACLASLTGLTRLVIEDLQYVGGAIHDEFCGLSRLTGLRSLSFLVVGPLPAEVMAWGALTQLTQLEITNHYDDNLLPCFSCVLPRLPHLRALNLSNFDITNAITAALRPCTQLSFLQMGRFNLTGPCKDCMPSVKVLQLNFVDDLQHTELPLVSVFPSLEELSLQTRYVLSDESAKRIPRELLMPNKHMPTTRLHLYDALMSPLLPVSLPALTALRLDWNQTPTRDLVSYMGQWGTGLTSLVWSNCDAVGDEGLAALAASLTKLTELELGRCVAVTDTGLMALSALTGLTSLSVSGAPQLTLAGFAPLLPQLRRLSRLALREMGTGISAEEAIRLEDLGWRLGGIQVDFQP